MEADLLELVKLIVMIAMLVFSVVVFPLTRTSLGKKLESKASLLSLSFYSVYNILVLMFYLGFKDPSATSDVGGFFQRVGLAALLLLVLLFYFHGRKKDGEWKLFSLLGLAIYLVQYVFSSLQYQGAMSKQGRVWYMPSLTPQFFVIVFLLFLMLFFLWKEELKKEMD